MPQVLRLEREQDVQHDYTVKQEHVCPKVDSFRGWIVQVIDQHDLKYQDGEHDVELERSLKLAILKDVTEDCDLVQQQQKTEINGCFLALLLADGVQEVFLRLLKFERNQVFWPFDEVVDLVVGWVLDDQSVVQVQVIVELEHVHGAFVDHVGLT